MSITNVKKFDLLISQLEYTVEHSYKEVLEWVERLKNNPFNGMEWGSHGAEAAIRYDCARNLLAFALKCAEDRNTNDDDVCKNALDKIILQVSDAQSRACTELNNSTSTMSNYSHQLQAKYWNGVRSWFSGQYGSI